MNIGERMKEPSSAAGAAIFANAVVALLANWRDPMALGSLIAGALAVFLPEKRSQ